MLQADLLFPQKNNSSFFAATQFIRQDAINNGGNTNAAKTYFEHKGKSFSFGARAGWKNKTWETSINYNRITGHGRYLMPREWGREPFFTFMPRERNEGFGDVNALITKIQYTQIIQPKESKIKPKALPFYHQKFPINFRPKLSRSFDI